MTASIRLAHHFLSPGYADFSQPYAGEMKRLLLDYCGVALAGSRVHSGELAGRFVMDMGGAGQSTVIGTDVQVPAVHAAFANAVAEHSLELDDIDELALFHYGPPIVSAALATAEWKHTTGTSLLSAMLAGCEMMNRLSQATNPELRNRGFHTTPTCGVFGATVAAGVLIGLAESTLTNALGLAGAQASGLMEMYGPSMQKRINPGPAARNGVSSAILAEMGFTGADTIFEGERGFGAAFAGGLDISALSDNLGADIPVTVEFKPYSAARPIHNAIDCALLLRNERSVDYRRIDQIVVHRHPSWAHYHLNNSPETYHEAQVSLPYSVALAFIEGKALPEQYADDQVHRADLVDLAGRVTVAVDDTLPRGVSCRMVVTLSDGSEVQCQVDDPKGSVGNPLSNSELTDKFRSLAVPVIGEDRANEVIDAVWNFEQISDVADFVLLVTPKGPHRGA